MYVMFLLLICRKFFRSCDTLVLARLSCIYCAVMHFPLLLHYDNSSAVHSALL